LAFLHCLRWREEEDNYEINQRPLRKRVNHEETLAEYLQDTMKISFVRENYQFRPIILIPF